ncbi:hypothetical protein FPV67DRAFT_1565621 [Lyophyllum atratum]|nr:hypothetical protein FPV67DRAFT_1565621 [Lyophyllum atratum]
MVVPAAEKMVILSEILKCSELSYRRYLAITAALNKMKTVKSWPGKPPTEKEVIELIIGKSQWSKVWRPTFQRVMQYHSDMATWLNGDTTIDAETLWGVDLLDYKLKHLQEWLDNRGGLSKGKGKPEEQSVTQSPSKASPEKKKKKKKEKKSANYFVQLWMLTMSPLLWLLIWLAFLPCAAASGATTPFPDIPFAAFSDFVLTTFNPDISLATVLLVLFSLVENPDLLNLHARQKHPNQQNENRIVASGWLKSLSRALGDRLGVETGLLMLFKENQMLSDSWDTDLTMKLDGFSELLGLTPYKQGVFSRQLRKVSQKSIEPVHVICPIDMTCMIPSCKSRHISVATRQRDIPFVTLLKGISIIKHVPVLTGECNKCHSLEKILNSANYIQIGSNLWVDQVFSDALLNAMYSFHASANIYTQFWNNSFGSVDSKNKFKISRKQIWQAFVQHSIRVVASSSNTTFETIPNIAIDDLTQHAFAVLGKGGEIPGAREHTCSDCTKPFKEHVGDTEPIPGTKPVNMLTLDGVVMGPQICAFEDCTNDLVNARSGALCAIHEVLLGSKCCMAGCQRNKVGETQACNEHLDIWRKSVQDRSKATINGILRILQRPGERQEWQQLPETAIQRPHDEEDPEAARFPRRKNYFSPNRSYCVETACAPCGVVLAWTKFAKSESPTNILNWLKDLFPTKDDRPSYVCIDKACQVFKTAVENRTWDDWKETTRFIVDAYHYGNHKATDKICRTWCNPAPTDGSAPNLVGEKIDEDGNLIQFREFNTQVCEQLNAWLGGYETILKRMTSQNFNWFIHTMLIYHVKHVLSKASSIPDENSSDDESSEDEESSSSSSSNDTSDDDESESGDTDSSDKDMDVDM